MFGLVLTNLKTRFNYYKFIISFNKTRKKTRIDQSIPRKQESNTGIQECIKSLKAMQNLISSLLSQHQRLSWLWHQHGVC